MKIKDSRKRAPEQAWAPWPKPSPLAFALPLSQTSEASFDDDDGLSDGLSLVESSRDGAPPAR